MLSQRCWIWQVFLYKLLKHYNPLTPVKHGTFLSGGIVFSLLYLCLSKLTGLAHVGCAWSGQSADGYVLTKALVSVQHDDDSGIALSDNS